MILLANKALHEKEGGQPLLGGLDVVVDRNHFGAQSQSFEAFVQISLPGSIEWYYYSVCVSSHFSWKPPDIGCF